MELEIESRNVAMIPDGRPRSNSAWVAYSEVSNLGDRNRSETDMNTGYAVVQIADF